jgi:glycosyltransferase involved in cell wall biosynthesis
MRILFVADTLGSGGKERQLVELLKGLDRRDDVSYALCMLSETVHYDDARKLEGKVHFVGRRSRYDPGVVRRLYSIGKEFHPDVIQSWELMCSVYALPVAKLLGVKFVSMIRNAPEKIFPFGDVWLRSKLTFPFSDLILANSVAGLRAYGINERKGRCIHNGFDLERLANLEDAEVVRRRFDIRTPSVVGMVGKFHPKKDNATFVLAAVRVCETRDDVTFVAVGDGVKLDQCKKMVPAQFTERVRFLGKQSHIESLVNMFDIGVLATYTEGISNSIMEYMALAKPVVATDGGGTRELVVDKVTGLLVGAVDPGDMAAKIQFLLDQPEKAREMGQEGRKRLEKDFNLETMAENFVDAYRDCLGE